MNTKAISSPRYRMPAEWEAQKTLWFSWPRAAKLWPDCMPKVHEELLRIIKILLDHHEVGIHGFTPTNSDSQNWLRTLGETARSRLILPAIRNNDAWCRDHGPSFVEDHQEKRLAGIDWNFNAWGEKYQPWTDDRLVASRLLEHLGCPRMVCPFIGEGGGLEVDGKGTVMLTESVWLNANRNPGIPKSKIEKWLLEHLGCQQAHWFTEGLAEDDTDGHVDMFARFVSPSAIVVCSEKRPHHPQYRAIAAIREQLQGFRTASSGHYDTIELPMPEALLHEGETCPASYGNFLIFNEWVLVPQYGQENADRKALGILGECFPGRKPLPVDCRHFITEGGAIHCLSQQQPIDPWAR
jgi:agmatine deiminase